jgi:hypothetical protein
MADTTVGVTKIVKLGSDTLLIVDVNPAQDIAEGEYTIESIKVVPKAKAGEDRDPLICVIQIPICIGHASA